MEDRGAEATAERLLALPGGLLLQQQQAQQLDQMRANLKRLLAQAQEVMGAGAEKLKKDYYTRLDLSWIYHDSALEGVVYQNPELILAMRGDPAPDPTLVGTFDEIRQNRAAIELVKEMAKQEKLRIDFDTLTAIYEKLAPDEMEGKKIPVYRKDMPIHRLYFHEIATPDKIVPKLKTFFQWINTAETRKSTHVVRLAAKAHFHLLHIYPFPKHSGRIARLVMNLILLHEDYLPAIIHSTERQRYYDALKTNDNALASVVREALVSSMESGARFFEAALPPPPPPPPKKITRPAKKAEAPRPASKPPRPLGLKPKVVLPSKPTPRRSGPIVPKTSGPLPKAFVSKASAPNRQPLMKMPIAVPVGAKPAAPVVAAPVKGAPPARPVAPAKAAKPTPPSKAPAAPAKAAPSKPVAGKVAPSKAGPSKAAPSKTPTKTAPSKPVKVAKAATVKATAKAKSAAPAKAKAAKAKPAPKAKAPKAKPAKGKKR